MTALTLEALREELAPIAARISNLEIQIAIMRPNVDGIPVLAKAIKVLQDDARMQHEDLRVQNAMLSRLEYATGMYAEQQRAIYEQLTQLRDRVRALEDVP